MRKNTEMGHEQFEIDQEEKNEISCWDSCLIFFGIKKYKKP